MSIPATRRPVLCRDQTLHWGHFGSILVRWRSRCLRPLIGLRVAVLSRSDATLDQFCCHAVADQPFQKLDDFDEHRLESLGGLGVSVRANAFLDAFNVRIRARAKINPV